MSIVQNMILKNKPIETYYSELCIKDRAAHCRHIYLKTKNKSIKYLNKKLWTK